MKIPSSSRYCKLDLYECYFDIAFPVGNNNIGCQNWEDARGMLVCFKAHLHLLFTFAISSFSFNLRERFGLLLHILNLTSTLSLSCTHSFQNGAKMLDHHERPTHRDAWAR